MKKIIILLIGIVLAFNAMSCRVDNDDLIEKIIILENIKSSETEEDEESPKLDEPSETEEGEEIEKPKDEDDVDESKDDSEKEDEESPKLDEPSETEEDEESPKLDEPSETEEDEENNTVVENKTWCEISEDTNILKLNYFVCVDGSQTKLNLYSTNENEARKSGFRASEYVSKSGKRAVFNVEYKDGKLNFSIPDNDNYKIYTITDVTMEGSNIYITIKWK